MKITEYDGATGSIKEKEISAIELKEIIGDETESKTYAEIEAERIQQRLAILNRLGISEQEAKLLLT